MSTAEPDLDSEPDSEPIPFTPEELAEAGQYSMLIAWSPEDDAYIVSVPELPNLHTHGATHQEAVEMGVDAIATWLAGMRHVGEPIPPPRFFSFEDAADGAG